MIGWFGLSLLAMLAYGVQGFLMKVAARGRYSTATTMLYFMGTAAVLGAISFGLSGERLSSVWQLVLLCLLNAALFFVITAVNIETLRILPAGVYFPAVRVSVVLVVLFSVVYFGDHLEPLQMLGIVLSLLVIVVLLGQGERRLIPPEHARKGGLLIALAVLVTAAVTIIVKFGADLHMPFAFITISYGLNVLPCHLLRNKLESGGGTKRGARPALIGITLGIANFLGFVALLRAFDEGVLSIAATVVGLAFVIPIALSIIIFREKVTAARVIAVGLAIAATALLR